MSLSDPIADMLTRIRNGSRVSKPEVKIRASKVCEGVASVLKSEGYIADYDRIDDDKQGILRVALKYSREGVPAITEIKRVSKPGRRIYSNMSDMPEVFGGLGIVIVSTNKGVMSDRNCRKENVGGEMICMVS
ncbi:MAG: 30S ribosomal protein S8 [Planctomycetes bacterium]|nr:30S ribosomal protein S8 [Planctomycetota bacterium]